jgi:hypothetical protein
VKLLPELVLLLGKKKNYTNLVKELFALDGKHANLTVNDIQRRNRIARLLEDWGLITIVDESKVTDIAPLNQIKVLSYRDKDDWILEQKYNIGKKGKDQETE